MAISKRTKVIGIGASIAALATSAVLLLPGAPCSLPHISFGGDRVGSQCQVVPEGLLFVKVNKPWVNPCSQSFVNVPCDAQIDGQMVEVGTCFGAREDCGECSIGVTYKYAPDPQCEVTRVRYKDK